MRCACVRASEMCTKKPYEKVEHTKSGLGDTKLGVADGNKKMRSPKLFRNMVFKGE